MEALALMFFGAYVAFAAWAWRRLRRYEVALRWYADPAFRWGADQGRCAREALGLPEPTEPEGLRVVRIGLPIQMDRGA